jgi:excisionase family DNA binding protein
MIPISQHATPATEDRVGLPAAARYLGLHRATVNEMVREGRIPADRDGAHWFIRRDDLVAFKNSYQRPQNAPRRRPKSQALSDTAMEIVVRLGDWKDATVAELAEVVGVHDGNVRKNLSILQARGLAVSDENGSWGLTVAGRRLVSIAAVSG